LEFKEAEKKERGKNETYNSRNETATEGTAQRGKMHTRKHGL
jgi:hypothetical protein